MIEKYRGKKNVNKKILTRSGNRGGRWGFIMMVRWGGGGDRTVDRSEDDGGVRQRGELLINYRRGARNVVVTRKGNGEKKKAKSRD